MEQPPDDVYELIQAFAKVAKNHDMETNLKALTTLVTGLAAISDEPRRTLQIFIELLQAIEESNSLEYIEKELREWIN
jgi:hypothetical protein